jgi:polyketide cyclase/dehydrase/lipid transport protein
MLPAHNDMGSWSSHIHVRADPGRVLTTLTDIRACEAWSPVPFEIVGRERERLETGSTVTVNGRIALRRVRFCVEVLRADAERLVLRAAGPVDMLASYRVSPVKGGSRLHAAISVRRGTGGGAAVAAHATCGLLRAGALKGALARIAREAERMGEPAAGQAA